MEISIDYDELGLLYYGSYSPLLNDLMKLGVDQKTLFASRILFHKIDNENPKFEEFNENL
jgi:hypothetical protein